MGSSAALCTAAVAALLEWYTGHEFEKEKVNLVSYQAEKYFHSNASGADVSTSCFGGLIYYRKEFEFLKTISSLSFKLPKRIEQNLFLIDTGKPAESTGDMVQMVRTRINKDPEKTEKLLSEIEKQTKRMVVSIIKEDMDFFKKSMYENEILLEKIGVVSPSAKRLIKTLSKYGTGKVTGGGGKRAGSGFVLFLGDEAEGLKKFLRENKLSYYKFHQGNQGLQKIA